jgi:hypothetical protein
MVLPPEEAGADPAEVDAAELVGVDPAELVGVDPDEPQPVTPAAASNAPARTGNTPNRRKLFNT